MTSGDPAPAFALPVIDPRGELGSPIALSSTAGKVTVLDFWATWCKPCLQALPRFDALAKRHPDVVVLAINIDDPAQARALFDERGYRPTLLFDDGTVSLRYGVTTIPHSVVIDRAGIVRLVARGDVTGVEDLVDKLRGDEIRRD
jgi:thiol-disulfide isomerase/thioredoxin